MRVGDYDAYDLEIEFIDSEQLSLTDLRDFAGQRGPAGKLRLVQFDLSLPGFAFVPASRYDRILLTQRGTIRVEGLRNFTATLPEVYGLVIQPNADELKVTRRLVAMLARRGYSQGMAFDVVKTQLAQEQERRSV